MTEPAADAVKRGLEAQFASLAAKQERGERLIGWKVGINDPAIQRHFGISSPVLGHLTTAALIEPGASHSVAGGRRVGVEPEVAIHLGPGGAIEALGPAIEVVDLDPAQTELEAILAGNVLQRAVALGPRAEGVGPPDLAAIEVTVQKGGSVAERARFADTGEDPETVVDLIATRLALVGERLEAGQVIIGGSLTPIVFVAPGDRVEVGLGPLGTLALALD